MDKVALSYRSSSILLFDIIVFASSSQREAPEPTATPNQTLQDRSTYLDLCLDRLASGSLSRRRGGRARPGDSPSRTVGVTVRAGTTLKGSELDLPWHGARTCWDARHHPVQSIAAVSGGHGKPTSWLQRHVHVRVRSKPRPSPNLHRPRPHLGPGSDGSDGHHMFRI